MQYLASQSYEGVGGTCDSSGGVVAAKVFGRGGGWEDVGSVEGGAREAAVEEMVGGAMPRR